MRSAVAELVPEPTEADLVRWVGELESQPGVPAGTEWMIHAAVPEYGGYLCVLEVRIPPTPSIFMLRRRAWPDYESGETSWIHGMRVDRSAMEAFGLAVVKAGRWPQL